jgi:protein-S-isoprenylcysteine O-methyltransferase Ste14
MLLLLRNVFWTLLIPGIVTAYVPWRVLGAGRTIFDRSFAQLSGLAIVALGALVILACVVEFATRGRGTLSPLDPPRALVIRGLYRYVRNPMYVGATLAILGQALYAQSLPVVLYWAIWFAWVNVIVLAYEEPALRRMFGPAYGEYCRRVPRWIPAMS